MTDFFDNIAWENTIEGWHIAVLLAVSFIGIYWEYRKLKPRKTARIIALIMVVISLYVMYLSPYTLTEKTRKSVVLINRNISENIRDSLKNEYSLTLLQQQKHSKFQEVGTKGLITLGQLNFKIDTAFVYGFFSQLNPEHYQVRKDIEMREVVEVSFPNTIALGDSLRMDIQNISNKNRSVTAIMGNDTLSRDIAAGAESNISSLPKSSGYILNEIYTDSSSYHFTVQVKEVEHYVIQILAASPDFEWKFLGDYLKSKEHSVYQKTQISKGKFKSSFFNWSDSLQINRGVAKDLKVLFTDAKAWEDLAVNTKNQFLNKLKENRGSLIFRTNPNSKIQLDLDKPKLTNIFSTSNNLLEANNYNYLQFNNIYQLDEVAQNSVFRKVNPDLIYGVINFQNSFQLKLSGKNQEYDQIWDPIFSHLIRNSTTVFYDKSDWSVQHQPFFFRLWSDDKNEEISIFNLKNDTVKLKSKPDHVFPERQHFMFYPQSEGWHFVQMKSQSGPIPFYVHSEVQANQQEFLTNYNRDYLNYRNFVDSDIQQEEEKYNHKPVTIWFFILFLISVGYLWVEDKIT
jgi:hypothetical protein